MFGRVRARVFMCVVYYSCAAYCSRLACICRITYSCRCVCLELYEYSCSAVSVCISVQVFLQAFAQCIYMYSVHYSNEGYRL